MAQFLVGLAGPDSSGVVYTVTEELNKIGCNVVDMSQTTLRNQFSSIMIADNPKDIPLDKVKEHVGKALEHRGFDMALTVTPYQEGKARITVGEPFVITVDGKESRDILTSFSRIFYEGRINIDSFRIIEENDENRHRVMMVYEVTVPTDIDRKALHRTLSEIAKSNGMSMSMQHRRIFEAIHRVGIA